MKITAVTAHREHFALSRPYTIAFRTINEVENFIVELRDDQGRVGLGCASPESHVTGEDDALCSASLAEESIAWLVGRDPRCLPALAREIAGRAPAAPAARAALDMALHDLYAQALGLPLVEVLGRAHQCLPTSITIGIKPTDEALAEADEYLARGFRVLKVKLGHVLEEDLERLARIRERCGPEIAIRVDPNQGYSRAEVEEFLSRGETLNIEFLEQPMAASDIEAMRALPPPARARVAADESLLGPRDALTLVAPPGACGIFNIKLMKCGGVSPARHIAAIADTVGIELMWGCMDESRISIAAALHTALACPATRYLDLDGHLDLARDVATGGFTIEDGWMRTGDAPGLGLTPLD